MVSAAMEARLGLGGMGKRVKGGGVKKRGGCAGRGKGVEIWGWGKQSLRGEAFTNFSVGFGDGGELGCGEVGNGGHHGHVAVGRKV